MHLSSYDITKISNRGLELDAILTSISSRFDVLFKLEKVLLFFVSEKLVFLPSVLHRHPPFHLR